MKEEKQDIIQELLQKCNIKTPSDIQEVLKDLFDSTLKEMMEAEMDDHLGYETFKHSDSNDYQDGYKKKQLTTSYGSMEIDVLQDRKPSFEPKIIKKQQKDISEID